jgi:hypothetical protein
MRFLGAGLFLAAALLPGAPVRAQATRTWVSGVGDDANPCSRTAPCKTFAGAISKTAARGEISVLDPGGFGAVTITKSITINGDGTLAGILVSFTNGIIVNAAATDKVVLRNLSINGVGTGIDGIRFLAGGNLVVDNVTISGFTGDGIDMTRSATGTLQVKNTTINGVATGIRLTSTVQFALASLNNVTITSTTSNAIDVGANSRLTISNSMISNNANGISATNASAVINVEGSQLAFNNNSAINASVSGVNLRISDNEIYNNTNGIGIAAGATVASTGNNRIFANGSSAAPNATITQQ